MTMEISPPNSNASRLLLSFEIALDNRLHAVWEKAEALTLSIYNANAGWVDTRPSTAPQTLRKMAEGFLEVASELDAAAREVAAEDKRFAESMAALGKAYSEAFSTFERDNLTNRLGEIARTPRGGTR
jgi:hypothetical protein